MAERPCCLMEDADQCYQCNDVLLFSATCVHLTRFKLVVKIQAVLSMLRVLYASHL